MIFCLSFGVFPGIMMLKDGSGPLKEWACFLAAALMTSAIAFPITLAYTLPANKFLTVVGLKKLMVEHSVVGFILRLR